MKVEALNKLHERSTRCRRAKLLGSRICDSEIKENAERIPNIEHNIKQKQPKERLVKYWRCGDYGHNERNCQARQDQRAENVTTNAKQKK